MMIRQFSLRVKALFLLIGVLAIVLGACVPQQEAWAKKKKPEVEQEEEEKEKPPTPEEEFIKAADLGEDIWLHDDLYLYGSVHIKHGADINGNGYRIVLVSESPVDAFLGFSGGSEYNPSRISDVTIQATSRGECGNGVLSSAGCVIEMSNVRITGFFQGLSSYGNVRMSDCELTGNGNDGWVSHGADSRGTIRNCYFDHNGDWLKEGGIADRFWRTYIYADDPNYGNAASGISSWGGIFTFEDCSFCDNENCGAVAQTNSRLTFKSCIFRRNGIVRTQKDNSGINVKANNYVDLQGGSVSGNGQDGVHIFEGTFSQSDGTIRDNGRYGIWQNGTYEMGKKASVHSSNTIFLTKGHWISLTEPFRHSEKIGIIETDEDDRNLGRRVVKGKDGISDSYVNSLNGRFSLTFDTVLKKSNGIRRKVKDAAVRAGNGVNAPKGTMILSGKFKGIYLNGLTQQQMEKVPEFSITQIPEPEKFYWKEPYTFQGTSQKAIPKKVLSDRNGRRDWYAIGGSLCFLGWKSSIGLAGEPLTDNTAVPAERLDDDLSFHCIWDFRYDLLFSGNSHTNLSEALDYEVYDYTIMTQMPENDGPGHNSALLRRDKGKTTGYFQRYYEWKAVDKKHYDYNRQQHTDFREQYAFEGWSKRKDCQYKDTDLFVPGEYFGRGISDYQDALNWYLSELSEITFAHGRTADQGKLEIVFYVVWDRFPEIQAFDRFYLKDEIEHGKLTDQELLAKVVADDVEDGRLENHRQVVITDCCISDFFSLGDAGSTSVRYAATDGAGNTSYYDIQVHVSDECGSSSWIPQRDGKGDIYLNPETGLTVKRTSPVYTRFISEEYFLAGANASTLKQALEEYDKGALEPYSKWYQLRDCREALRQALSNIVNRQYRLRYVYGQKQIANAQYYLRTGREEAGSDAFRMKFYRTYVQNAVR